MNSRKTILLTGASGTVGSEILNQLMALDLYDVTVFDKKMVKTEKVFKYFDGKVEVVYGDLTKRKDVDLVTKNKDVVIHVGALIPPAADDYPEIAEKVNVEGTAHLIRSLEENSPSCFFLYSSSISVYGDRIAQPYIRVGEPLKPSEGDYYAETKIAAEDLLMNSTLNWSVFRLTAIMGNHKISKLMFHMPLETPLEICTPSDTARAFVKAIEKEEVLQKKIFNLGGGAACRTTYREFLQRSFKIMGLGALDFPEHSFATQNFHCGYYADGDELEDLLHFRQDTLEDYFKNVDKSVSSVQKFFTRLFRKPIKWYLKIESEPLEAYKRGEEELMLRFFGSLEH